MAGRRHCSVRTTGATAGRIRHDGKGALRQLKLLARLRAAHGLAFLDDDWMLSALARRPAAVSPLVRSPPDRATPAATAANVAVPEEAEAEQRVAGLSLDLGSFYMPKKGESPRGEDAHFVSEALGAFGVADGVGSWSNRGIDAGELARQLMSFCEADLGTGCSRRGNASPGTALEGLLERALARTTARGTSTACVAVVDGRILRAVNVGDSGFLVVRGGKIVYRSPFQQRGFNQPFQVGGVDRSYPPEYASRLCVEIEPGDIIVAGTDGLFDNLFDEETLDVLARAEADGHGAPEEMAHALGCAAVQAYEAGVGRETPFSMACREAKFFWRGGGKDDDVTVVIARVR